MGQCFFRCDWDTGRRFRRQNFSLQLRDFWRKPRDHKRDDRFMIPYIQVTAVNSLPKVEILPREGVVMLTDSALMEIHQLGILRVFSSSEVNKWSTDLFLCLQENQYLLVQKIIIFHEFCIFADF